MVYQWTNFVWETNAWWLRRIRPVFITFLSSSLLSWELLHSQHFMEVDITFLENGHIINKDNSQKLN